MKDILIPKYFKGSEKKRNAIKQIGIVLKTNTSIELYEAFEKLSYRQLVNYLKDKSWKKCRFK